jgi:hypothetical protein
MKKILAFSASATMALGVLAFGLPDVWAAPTNNPSKILPAANSAKSSGPGFTSIIPHGLLLHKPATQPTCSKLPVSYELGTGFQLDRTHCLLVSNLDEQGGPDLCIGNDAFVFEHLSDIKPEKAIIINRAEPEYKSPGGSNTSFLAKYPVSGFFVPLGALLPNGQPHPAAGSGLLTSVCVAYAADRSDPTGAGETETNWKSWETLLEFIQVRWDGKSLKITDTQKVRKLFGKPLLAGTFSHLSPMDKGAVGPFEFRDEGLRPVRFDWNGQAWVATQLGDAFEVANTEFEATIQQQGNRYLISTRDDKTPKVRVYASDDGLKFKFLFESKNHYVPRSLNKGLDGTIYLATNPGPGFLRNPLLAYPMFGDAFGEPSIIHDQDGVRNDKGDKIPFVDHGQGANLFLENRWRHIIFYRVCDLKERTLYGFQKGLIKQFHGDKGPIPKRSTSGIYAAELQYATVTAAPFVFAEK